MCIIYVFFLRKLLFFKNSFQLISVPWTTWRPSSRTRPRSPPTSFTAAASSRRFSTSSQRPRLRTSARTRSWRESSSNFRSSESKSSGSVSRGRSRETPNRPRLLQPTRWSGNSSPFSSQSKSYRSIFMTIVSPDMAFRYANYLFNTTEK